MKRKILGILFACLLVVTGCNDVWDDHVKVANNVSQISIAQYIASKSDLSVFWTLMQETGVDKQLDSSNLYTVWTPNNDAMGLLSVSFASEAEKRKFVLNHITYGRYSAVSKPETDTLYMLSQKRLIYNPSAASIDGAAINISSEATLKNGIVQLVSAPMVPRFSIWDWVKEVAPENKFIKYLKSLDFEYFDPIASGYLGTDDQGNAIYEDSVVVTRNLFLLQVADLDSEDSTFTFFVPSDEIMDAEFSKFERYYRVEDRLSNPIPTAADSANIWMNVVKDYVFGETYTLADAPDTLVSFFEVKVPFVKSSVQSSFSASNGSVFEVSDCNIKASHKILPITINAETGLYSPSLGSVGTNGLYRRERANALGGYDIIVDNHANSGISSGMVLRGPRVCSIKYRVKIRAINDFNKSTFWPDASVTLQQMVGTVTVIRDKETGEFKGLSTNTNYLNSTGGFGTADVVYDPAVPASYYVPFTQNAYSLIELAENDEKDLGYYQFSYMEYAFLRILPFAAKMAVTADYVRLVPIIE